MPPTDRERQPVTSPTLEVGHCMKRIVPEDFSKDLFADSVPAKQEIVPAIQTPGTFPRKLERILQTASDLDNDPAGQSDVSYMHSVLTQVSLPRRRVVGQEL